MQYQEQGEYKTEPTRDDAYRVNWVRVYSAYNAQTDPDLDVTVPDASKPVSAKVQYQPRLTLEAMTNPPGGMLPNGAIENVKAWERMARPFRFPPDWKRWRSGWFIPAWIGIS